MRGYLILALLPGVVACKGEGERVPDPPAPLETVTLEQFRSLFWLEGRWRGTLNDTAPFFEAYRVRDDSTIVSITFTDSTLTQVQDSSLIRLRGGSVLSGDEGAGYRLTSLDSTSAHFEPRGRASNAFTWTRQSDGSWVATLTWRDASGQPARRVYVMRPLP